MKISNFSNKFGENRSDIYFTKRLKIEKENSRNINEVTPENKEFYMEGNFMQNLSTLVQCPDLVLNYWKILILLNFDFGNIFRDFDIPVNFW